MDSIFNSQYSQLNPAQKKAVDAIEGPVMVIAGPGTGKTTILTLRIANILKQTDTAPDNILALTFTESGAYNMRKKLVEIIGPAAYKVHINTFHSFASEIIEKYPDYFARIIGSRVITEPEQIKIIKGILQSKKIKMLRPYGDKDYYVGPVLREIQILKRENISPKAFLSVIPAKAGIQKASSYSSVGSVPLDSRLRGNDTVAERLKKQTEKNLELAFVYSEYEKALADEKYYDFEDMLLELIRAIEKDDIFKLMLQETYQYILADEHQDANASQNRILELLSDFHDSPNLFIVGDDKQAIYRFQGATLENFLFFNRKYKDALVIDLEHNYRSHQGILDASHSLIEKNPAIPGRERKRLISLQMGTMPIFVTECSSINEELELVARDAKRLIQNGNKSEEIAILYRDNKHADPISRALKANGVEHRIESDHNILNEPDVIKILYLGRAINDPSSGEALAKALLLRELKCDPAHVADICAKANREKKPLYGFMAEYKDTAAAYERIKDWSHEAILLPCTDFLQKLIQDAGMIEEIVKDANSLVRLSSLQAFYDHVASVAKSQQTFYLKDLIEYIDIADEKGVSSKRRYTDHISGVRLMTAHRAKGLEFEHVFIVHAADGIWGNRTSRSHFTIPLIEHARNVGRIEDERRLFYVAMTRARDTVHITYARSDGEKELLPSQFISEIDPMLIDRDRISSDEPASDAHPISLVPKKESGISILNKEFVATKFLAQPLSVTHLNNYLKCPWHYFFVNLIRVPQAETKHQMYGTAIHSVLRNYFEAYKDGRAINVKKVIVLFKHSLDMLSLGKDDREESFEKGKKALEGYFKTYSGTWNKRLLTEYGVRGNLVIPAKAGIQKQGIGSGTDVAQSNIKIQENSNTSTDSALLDSRLRGNDTVVELTGKLDKIEFLDDHHVAVVDYKTSKPKSRNVIEGKTKDSDGNYKRQLVFYKLLLDSRADSPFEKGGVPRQSRGMGDFRNFSMKYGEIDFIEPNDAKKYKKERFEVSEKEVEELKEVIKQMAKEVVGLEFVEKGCGEKECEFCRLGKLLNENK